MSGRDDVAVPFVPETIQLHEGDEENPYDWSMTAPLAWTGTFRGKVGRLRVPASPTEPFTTDLASVPRFLTWLFPRYGKYTKAAVLHDYFCRNIGTETVAVYATQEAPAEKGAEAAEPQLLELADRSDADEIFRLAMTELGVPWARRWLMWSAVNWATLFTSLRTGRSSKPVLRWVGVAVLALAVVATAALVWGGVSWIVDEPVDWRWLRITGLVIVASSAIAAGLIVAGYLAQGRWDRWLVCLAAFGMTIASLPLLAVGLMIALLLVLYLLFEDAFSGGGLC